MLKELAKLVCEAANKPAEDFSKLLKDSTPTDQEQLQKLKTDLVQRYRQELVAREIFLNAWKERLDPAVSEAPPQTNQSVSLYQFGMSIILRFIHHKRTLKHIWRVQRIRRDKMTLPESWSTERCSCLVATEYDIVTVTRIYAENMPLVQLLDPYPDPQAKAEAIIGHMEVPLDSRNQTFIIKIDTEPLGVLEVYLGYPNKKTLYIGELFLVSEQHGKGLGREIVEELERLSTQAGFGEIRLGVGLKNLKALRFWVHIGYDRITRITGNSFDYSKAVVELARPVRKVESRCAEFHTTSKI